MELVPKWAKEAAKLGLRMQALVCEYQLKDDERGDYAHQEYYQKRLAALEAEIDRL